MSRFSFLVSQISFSSHLFILSLLPSCWALCSAGTVNARPTNVAHGPYPRPCRQPRRANVTWACRSNGCLISFLLFWGLDVNSTSAYMTTRLAKRLEPGPVHRPPGYAASSKATAHIIERWSNCQSLRTACLTCRSLSGCPRSLVRGSPSHRRWSHMQMCCQCAPTKFRGWVAQGFNVTFQPTPLKICDWATTRIRMRCSPLCGGWERLQV